MKVVFFANPGSVHVRRWLELARSAAIDVEGWSVDRIDEADLERWRTSVTVGGVFRYALAGLHMRMRHRTGRLVHAHNASGYGLMAWLSGGLYILTVYGSDVYLAPERGPIYRRLLRAILRSAARVTCTTPAMRDHLVLAYGIDPARIHMFSLGISLHQFYFSDEERLEARNALTLKDAVVIMSNRRMRPQYRVELLVHAFAILYARDPRYRLLLLEGDSIPEYARDIVQLIADKGLSNSVLVIRGFRTPAEVRRYLLASDVVVSIPTSDQMSAAVLEALACGTTLVAAQIPAYDELFREGLAYPAAVESPEALAASIERVPASTQQRTATRDKAENWVQRFHSDRAVLPHVLELYAGLANL